MIRNYRIDAPIEFHQWLNGVLLARVASNSGGPDVPVEPQPPKPEVNRRLSRSFASLNMHIKESTSARRYVLKDFFTTYQGKWDVGVQPNAPHASAIEQWARDSYLKPWGHPEYVDSFGGDHNMFAAVIGKDGKFKRNMPIRFAWPDGLDIRHTSDKHGWADLPFFNSYSPSSGEMGSWMWGPEDGDTLVGASMPDGHHVSFFGVWLEV